MKRMFKGALTLTCSAVLVACGGGGGGGEDGPSGNTLSVSGILVVPQSTATSSARAMKRAATAASGSRREVSAFPGCPDVPDGYEPLATVAVEFKNAVGLVLSTITTDSCGAFSGSVPQEATVATAQPASASPISQPVSSLITVAGAAAPVVSTLPAGATHVIGVVQDLGAAKIAITVSDSLTGKAVLGLNAADFGFAAGTAAIGLNSLNYGASQAQGNASVSVVLDSSGSMSSLVGTTGKSRYQVAAIAAHELLNGLTSGADEANVTFFASRVFTMNDATLAALNWVDPLGVATPDYTFSATGVTRSIAALRPVIDLYNPRSKIYASNASSTTADDVHPDTGNLRISSRYTFSGSTAFWDGTISGVNALATAGNARKIVVSMTDGQENASRARLPDVIATAKAQNVPVFTVGFGSASQVDEADMQAIADQTGGQYKRVEGLDLAGLFQGIQTGIRFQYVATLAATQPSGTVITITLSRGATPVTRTLTIN